MLKKIKKMIAIAGLSFTLFGTLGMQAQAATETVTVHKGDTLWSISKAHHVAVSDIKKWNKLKSDTIKPGLKLNVTNNTVATNAVIKRVSSANTTSSNVVKTITMKASAYTASCLKCSGLTSTGLNLKANPNLKVIAVDPSIIPLGSKVYVQGYGNAIAGDTGGGIKGNKIDVFIPSEQQAIQFGVKTVKVTVYK